MKTQQNTRCFLFASIIYNVISREPYNKNRMRKKCSRQNLLRGGGKVWHCVAGNLWGVENPVGNIKATVHGNTRPLCAMCMLSTFANIYYICGGGTSSPITLLFMQQLYYSKKCKNVPFTRNYFQQASFRCEPIFVKWRFISVTLSLAISIVIWG